MRRERVIETIDTVISALNEAQVREAMNLLRGADPNVDSATRLQQLFTSYSVFSQRYAAFGEEELKLMAQFGLLPLVNANFWSGAMEGDPNVVGQSFADVDVGVYNLLYVVPKLIDYIVGDDAMGERVVTLDDGSEQNLKRFRLNFADNGRDLTETFHLMNIIKAVEDYYEAVRLVHATEPMSLSVGGVDAGGSRIIDFYGSDFIIQDMIDVLAEVWHLVKISMEDNVRQRTENVLLKTSFEKRLAAAKRKKLVNKDEAKRVVHTMSKSVDALFRAGAFVEQMEEVTDLRASTVLQHRTDLIEYHGDIDDDGPEHLEIFKKPSILEEDDEEEPMSVVPSVVSKGTRNGKETSQES